MKGCAGKLGLSVLSLFVACIGLEIAARFLMPSAVPRNIIDHPVLNHVWRPSFSHEHGEYEKAGVPPYTHTYNAQGFIAAKDLQISKPINEKRIFILGDSFVEGTVPMEQSMPSVVQKTLVPLLAKRGLTAKVVNAGISSYSPLLHYLMVTKYLLRYKPDVIVVAVDMTDVFDDFLYRSIATKGADGEIIAVPANSEFARRYERTAKGLRERSVVERALLPLFEHSRLAQFVSIAISLRSPTAQNMPGLFDWCIEEKRSGRLSPMTAGNVAFSMSMLQKLSAVLRSEGIQLIVTAVPHLEQFEGTWSTSPLTTVQNTCKVMDEPYFDTFSAFKDSLPPGTSAASLFLEGDMHFNARGYEIWGTRLASYLDDIIAKDVS